MERKEALTLLAVLAREFPTGANSVAELDEALLVLTPLLRKLLPVFVLSGVRTLPASEEAAQGDTEKEYWFAAADPELAASLACWLDKDLVDRLKKVGVVTFETPTGVQKKKLGELLQRSRRETTG